MFIGHYAPAFAMRVFNPSGPRLGALFLAAQAVDYGFFSFSLMGIERSVHNPALRGFMPIDLVYMPFTHSLFPATLIWALIGGFLASVLAPKGQKAAFGWGAGLVVASHWFCDLLVHRPDLGVLWETPKLGFGIWNYPVLSAALELTILAIPVALYAASRCYQGLKAALPLLVLITILVVAQCVNWFSSAPTDLLATAIPPLLVFTVFAALAFWVDKPAQT